MKHYFSSDLSMLLLCSGVQVCVQVFVSDLRSLNLNEMFTLALNFIFYAIVTIT